MVNCYNDYMIKNSNRPIGEQYSPLDDVIISNRPIRGKDLVENTITTITTDLLNAEALGTVGAHELPKAANRDTAGAAYKLQQSRPDRELESAMN